MMNTTDQIATALAEVTTAYALWKSTADNTPEDEAAERKYNAAAAAAVELIQSKLAARIEQIDVSAASYIDEPEEMGGGLYANYTVDLEIGDVTHTIGGWAVCGWIAPGASEDLDGSGLACWGSSQPGGWSSCDTDGQTRGNITVTEGDGVISVEPGYGRDGKITISVVELIGLSPEQTAICTQHLYLTGVLSPLARKIEAALDGVDTSVPEPSGYDVYYDIESRKGTLTLGDTVLVGQYCGVYPVVVVENKDGDYDAYQPGDSWESPVKSAVEQAVQSHLDSMSEE